VVAFLVVLLIMKKIYFFIVIIFSIFILSSCTVKNTSDIKNSPTSVTSVSQETKPAGKCIPENVTIEGYGDKGKRLSNCFVQYPGEPSRQDKSYYIVEDICGQFTKEFISNVLGKNVIKTQPAAASTVYACSYYTSDKDYVMLVLDYLKFANQKIGQEAMGRTTTENPKIPMKNMIVYQEDGLINSLYLVLSDDKFISIQRSSGTAFTSDELINFAANISQEIKNYK
jgi:hypothetical protein